TYLNDAACGVFGLEAGDAIGKRLDERIRGLDWESLTRSSGPVSHDMEIFYPQNRFINFYVVPLVMEQREPTVTGGDDSGGNWLGGAGGTPRARNAASGRQAVLVVERLYRLRPALQTLQA